MIITRMLPVAIIIWALSVISLASARNVNVPQDNVLESYQSEDTNKGLQGYQDKSHKAPTDKQWAIRLIDGQFAIDIDSYNNLIVTVGEIPLNAEGTDPPANLSYDMFKPSVYKVVESNDRPEVSYLFVPGKPDELKALIKTMFQEDAVKARAQQKQKEMFEKEKFWRPCPHSLQIVFEGVGPLEDRSIFKQDLDQVIPDGDWPVSATNDYQKGRVLFIKNMCGRFFTIPPGATFNAGVTAWLYDGKHNKVLKVLQKYHGKEIQKMPAGHVDLVKDRRPVETFPHLSKVSADKRIDLGRGFWNIQYAALRKLVEEVGLNRQQFQNAVPEDIIEGIVNQPGKLVQIQEWTTNPLAHSFNFHLLFEADGLSEFDTKIFEVSKAKEISGVFWDNVSEKDKYAIDHAWALHSESDVKGHNLQTCAIKPLEPKPFPSIIT